MTDLLKLLTYNVHRGRSAFRRRDVCAEIAGILDFSSADVVCLQEVWQHDGVDRHQLEDHTADLWEHRVFARNVTFRQGAQGNAVLSRLPVTLWNNFDISIARREPRGILHTQLQVPGKDAHVTVFCVHFGLTLSERRRQAALLEQFIGRHVPHGAPYFVAGDFNDWTGELHGFFRDRLHAHEVMQEASGRAGRTFPALWPLLSLDRIYFRNCRLKFARVVRERRCLALSDHLPIEAEFEITGW
jgi:endonuclease/exonuclease/phosphatase family metal-dependent hydrolase